jgi:hypothetical protein
MMLPENNCYTNQSCCLNKLLSLPLILFTITITYNWDWGNSVSIVSGYGLDDRAIEDRSPAEAKGFFL